MNAKELYQAGRLSEAIAAATDDVKRRPGDSASRAFLCELLCFAGDFERADTQANAIGDQDPTTLVVVSLLRHLIRGELARRQFYQEGRLPEFLEVPAPRMKSLLEASICLREGRAEDAAKLLEGAEKERPHVGGECNGRPFEDLYDLDEMTASFFEVLTGNGKYYWVPIESVQSLEFRAPRQLRDLLWRSAHLIVRGGLDGEVYLPVLYAGSHAEPDDRIRLGRMTDWRGGPNVPLRGVGQRMFQVGQDELAILELQEIAIRHPEG